MRDRIHNKYDMKNQGQSRAAQGGNQKCDKTLSPKGRVILQTALDQLQHRKHQIA